ncbi:unnamed protein product [Hermetia illucens]|uniref:cGMP-dependent protein kinase interacting domain-containing protein n=1 Tax=Hermetia illucens TaxID=343691 RepID=A0A7R8YR16_HERIL|nr:unnamed protein product [Hermetia illucens]
MSFRSRSRTTQPIPPTRRRSLSSSRVTPSVGPSSQPSLYNGTQSYSRPYTGGGYYPMQSNSASSYQSPYLANHYGSRENVYNHSPRNGFYPSGSYDKRYGSNAYASDRYVSPYSSYDNGVTTAGLSLGISPKTYTPSQIGNSKPKSSSNQSLNSYQLSKPNKVSTGTNTPPVILNRSASLREQERKGRSRTRSRAIAARSASVSSEKSEGYESGSERLSRSRVGSSGSLSGEQNDSKSNTDATENGEVIDYKALWEAVKLENEQLKQELKKKDEELSTAKAAVDRFANATTKNSLSELEKRERRAMERKLSEMEEELKHLDVLKAENQRLKEENGALIRVISKLSK